MSELNLRHKCFDVEYYEELNQKKLKGMVCFEKDLLEKIKEFDDWLLNNSYVSKHNSIYEFRRIFGGHKE